MNQVPHITIEQAKHAFTGAVAPLELLKIYNERIDKANAEQSQEQPLISAEEARKLGAGNCLCLDADGQWRVTTDKCEFPKWRGTSEIKYRALQPQAQPEPTIQKTSLTDELERTKSFYKPEPVEPHAELKAMYEQQVKDGTVDLFRWDYNHHGTSGQWLECGVPPNWNPTTEYRCVNLPTCQVRNEDTGELKTMTREAAKLLQAETKDVCDWFLDGDRMPEDYEIEFNVEGIYTYKRKANLVKLDGKLMSREAAIALWESKKDTHRVWFKLPYMDGFDNVILLNGEVPVFNSDDVEYQLRARPLKQIDWKDVPVGVMLRVRATGSIVECRSFNRLTDGIRTESIDGHGRTMTNERTSEAFELAPADQQPWIAVQDDDLHTMHGKEKWLANHGILIEVHDSEEKYRITGIAKGWKL